MACYKRFRGLCTVWCSLEIFLFSGIIYGWSSLVYVFINERFYSELCSTTIDQQHTVGNSNTTVRLLQNVQKYDRVFLEGDHNRTIDTYDREVSTCGDQESRLGLWFSIGVGCTWAGMAVLGPLSKVLGTRITRVIILIIYEVGLLCLAFSTTETPWLVCPGLCCIGIAGLAHFASNIQIANLFTTFSSTIVALFCGLFDSSSIIFQLVKLAYGLGIGHKETFLFLACLYLVMIGTSTFFILPKCYISSPIKEIEVQIDLTDTADYQLTETHHVEEDIPQINKGQQCRTRESVFRYMLSLTYVSHVAWMTVHCLLFATFLNLLHIRIERLSNGQKHVASYYLGVFAYTTMGSVIGSIIAGMIYDAERKRYRDSPFPMRKWRPVVIPMFACGIFITTVFCLMMEGDISFLLPSFILFTLYRNFLFSTGIAFINEGFPTEYFGHLYGIMTFVNGLFSLLQYGFVKWTVHFLNGYYRVHIVLIILAVLTILHPVQLWIRSGKYFSKDYLEKSDSKATQILLQQQTEKETL